jgi:hypothetical protein
LHERSVFLRRGSLLACARGRYCLRERSLLACARGRYFLRERSVFLCERSVFLCERSVLLQRIPPAELPMQRQNEKGPVLQNVLRIVLALAARRARPPNTPQQWFLTRRFGNSLCERSVYVAREVVIMASSCKWRPASLPGGDPNLREGSVFALFT